MSHAKKADKLLIKPAAGARPAPPRTRRRFIPKARTRRPVTRRVTRGTATTRLATTPDRPTRRVLPSLEGRLCRRTGLDRERDDESGKRRLDENSNVCEVAPATRPEYGDLDVPNHDQPGEASGMERSSADRSA